MSDSILTSVKKALGLGEDYNAFDDEIIMHINSVFSTLSQLGVGPDAGFMIEDATATWDTLLGDDPRLNSAKTLTFLKVKMVFDPPATSFVLTAMERQIEQMEWRLNAQIEREAWQNPESSADDVTVWTINENDPLPEEMEPGDIGIDPLTGNVWRMT